MAYIECEKLLNIVKWRSMLSDSKTNWANIKSRKKIETELKKLEAKLPKLKIQAAKYRGHKNYPLQVFETL